MHQINHAYQKILLMGYTYASCNFSTHEPIWIVIIRNRLYTDFLPKQGRGFSLQKTGICARIWVEWGPHPLVKYGRQSFQIHCLG